MPRHMTDRSIGIRAIEEFMRCCYCRKKNGQPHISNELKRLGMGLTVYQNWLSGVSPPSTHSLAILAHNGGDVHYILTGVRKGCG